MVKELDENLRHLSRIIKQYLNKDVQNIPGAAGGLGAGLVAFLDADLRPGIEILLEANKMSEKMKRVDLVITGEGKIDGQTINGKTPIGVSKLARKHGVPVIALCGATGEGVQKVLSDITAVFSIMQQPLTLEEVFENSEEWLQFTTEQVLKIILLKKKQGDGSFTS